MSDANATNGRLVWKFGDQLTAPTWNPTGTMLAVVLDPNTDRADNPLCPCLPSGLWTVHPNGTSPHLVLPTHETIYTTETISEQAAWSPDGQRLAYATRTQIETIPVKGGVPTPIGGNHAGPNYRDETLSWSPDGRDVLVDNSQVVDVFPVTGGHVQALLSPQPKTPIGVRPTRLMAQISATSSIRLLRDQR